MKKERINLYPFTSKDKRVPELCGILHQDGCQLATDRFTMVVLRKQTYPNDYEDKIIDRKGLFISNRKANIHKYMWAIPDKVESRERVTFSFEPIISWYNEHKNIICPFCGSKSNKKTNKTFGLVKLGDRYFDVTRLVPVLRLMKKLKIAEVYIHKYLLYAYNDTTDILLMSFPYNDGDDVLLYIPKTNH